MPTYSSQVLGLDLMKSGLYSVLPWITMAIAANVGGWVADAMVAKGVTVTRVRKIMQTVRCSHTVRNNMSLLKEAVSCSCSCALCYAIGCRVCDTCCQKT